MAKQTRRKFLKQTSVVVATVGVVGGALVAAPRLSAMAAPSDAAAKELSTAKLSGPMMAYVRDLSKGEVGILVGTREVVYRDPDLVVRLVRATQ